MTKISHTQLLNNPCCLSGYQSMQMGQSSASWGCIRVLHRNKTNRRDTYIWTGSCSYGDWEVPWSVTSKLEKQEHLWYNLVQIQRPKNQEGTCLRAEEGGCPSSGREHILPSSHLFNLLKPTTDWTMPAPWWGWSSLLSLLVQMLVFSGNTLKDTFSNNVLPAMWTSLSPVKWTHKITHHRWYYQLH